MFTKFSDNIKGLILAVIGFSAFAIADANAKHLSQHYDVVQIIGTVAIFSTLLTLLLAPLMGGFGRTLRTRKLKIHIGRGLCNAVISFFIVLSFSKLTMAQVYTLVFTAPFITTLLAIPIYGEKVDKHGWIAIAGGFAGVLIVLRPGFGEADPWLLAAFITAFFVSGLFLLARALDERETLLSLAIFPSVTNLLFFTPFVFLIFGFPASEHLWQFVLQGFMLIIGLCGTALAFRLGKSSVVGPIHYIQIVWAAVFGYVLFNDIPGPWTISGALVIIASGLYLIQKERHIAKATTRG